MSTNSPIAEDQRSPSLKIAVRKYVDLFSQISKTHTDLARQHQHLFFYLCYPWLVDTGGEAEIEAKLAQQRHEYAALGFPGEAVKQELELIMSEDRHLTECCSTLVNLGYLLDIEFISYAVFHQNQHGFGDEEYDKVFRGFSSSVAGLDQTN